MDLRPSQGESKDRLSSGPVGGPTGGTELWSQGPGTHGRPEAALGLWMTTSSKPRARTNRRRAGALLSRQSTIDAAKAERPLPSQGPSPWPHADSQHLRGRNSQVFPGGRGDNTAQNTLAGNRSPGRWSKALPPLTVILRNTQLVESIYKV